METKRSSAQDQENEKQNGLPPETVPLMRQLSSGSWSSSQSTEENSTRNTWLYFVFSWLWGLKKKKDLTEEEERRRKRRMVAMAAVAVVITYGVVHRYYKRNGKTVLKSFLSSFISSRGTARTNKYIHSRAKETPLSVLYKAAKQGHIQRALWLSSSSVAYQIKDGSWKRTLLPDASLHSGLVQALSDGGCTDITTKPESLVSKLSTPTLAALPFVYLALLSKIIYNIHNRVDSARTRNQEDCDGVTFKDVAGLDNVVVEVREVVDYLDTPHIYASVGARPPRGILLHGPPGSGKTLLARAIAGEAQNCKAFVACSGSDFVESYVGRGAARIRALFDQARNEAQGQRSWSSWFCSSQRQEDEVVPSAVVFMDEIDALAKTRSGPGGLSTGGNDERDQTLNQLLCELDGFASSEQVTIIFIAATNRPDVLDPAMLRRLDRQIHVGYPNAEGRKAILQIHLNKVAVGSSVDLNILASDQVSNGFSGADLRNIVNDAALLAVREKCTLVEQRHLLRASRRVRQQQMAILASLGNLNGESHLPPNL